ncbi:MAG: hypothetical protein JW881_06775 [Spirochaetales bacterium]|nr:hypothetical protein [Spirochaetales bacterium]
MAERVVNFEDNIFFLQHLIKNLKKGLKLDIDSRYFIQKIAQDIIFYATTIDQIYKKLRTNNNMLHRADYLKSIQRLKKEFNGLIDDILAKRFSIAPAFGTYLDRFREIYRAYERDISEIRRLFLKAGEDGFEQEKIVSEEEFRILMSQEEEKS